MYSVQLKDCSVELNLKSSPEAIWWVSSEKAEFLQELLKKMKILLLILGIIGAFVVCIAVFFLLVKYWSDRFLK